MPLLLDTQIIIWLEENPAKISEKAKVEILNEPVLWCSKASIWEMAIKVKIGKLSLKQPLELFIENFVRDYNCFVSDITLKQIFYTQQLPFHHRDPFDRLLTAQSILENIPIISSDTLFDAYDVKRIW